MSADISPLVRNFKENGFKFLLEAPANTQDLVRLLKPQLAPHLDFARMETLRGTFIEPSFHHLESDLFLRVPLLGQGGQEAAPIHVYTLIEHQSDPDRWALLRALRYQLSAFEWQQTQWLQQHKSLKDFQLRPVLPIVLYSGHKSWTEPKTMAELISWDGLEAIRAEVEPYVPCLETVFFNLSSTEPAELYGRGGLFGRILHVFQQRHSPGDHLEGVLEQAVGELERQASRDRPRWQQMMWFLRALLYHERQDDAERLVERVCDWVRAERRKREFRAMSMTYAERVRLGELTRFGQETLVRHIRLKFQVLPAEMEQTIRSTQDLTKLEGWLDAIVTAEKLEDLGIVPGH